MTPIEKKLFFRVQECLHEVANLVPSNACDIEALSRGCNAAARAGRELYMAVSSIGFKDYPEAAESLSQAELILAEWRANRSKNRPPAAV